MTRVRRQSGCTLAAEDGFSLVEAVIALTLIFSSITAMAYTATIGFKYSALARERQSATAIADQVMESVRGVAWSRFTQGVRTSDLQAESTALGSSSNVISCNGVWYFRSSLSMSCLNVGGAAPAPEKVVTTAGLPDQCTDSATPCPMVPNSGTVSSTATVKYPTTYTWRVYPTTDNASGIYKVYVMVRWSVAQFGTGVVKSIMLQTTFYNPAGCVSSDVHPFSGPCQPQYAGSSVLNGSGIAITSQPGVSGVNFASATLVMPTVAANSIVEQVPKLSGSATYGGIEVITTVGGAPTVYGETTVATSAGDNPTASGVGKYMTAGPTSSFPTSPSTVNAGNGTLLALLFGQESGTNVVASTSATAPSSQTCAATAGPFTLQLDGNPCVQSWTRVSQPMSATIDLGPAVVGVTGDPLYGSTIASLQATSQSYSVAGSADRLVMPADGMDAIQQTVQRSLGTVTLFTFPSICTTSPAGWDNTRGLIQISNYKDSAVATAGSSTVSAIPSIQIDNAASLTYYDGNNSDGSYYTTISGNQFKQTTIPAFAIPSSVSCSATVNGKPFKVVLSVPVTGQSPVGPAGKNQQESTSSSGVKTAQAQIGSPVYGTVGYTVSYNSSVKSALLVALDLGMIVAKASYTPPPTGG